MRRKSILSLILLVSLILCISAVSASEISDTNSSVSSVNTFSTDSNLINTNVDNSDNYDLSEAYSSDASSSDSLSEDSSNNVEFINSKESTEESSIEPNTKISNNEASIVKDSQSNGPYKAINPSVVSSDASAVVKSNSLTKTYINGTNKTILNGNRYYVGLFDSNNNILSNQIITFKINGKTFTSKTSKTGHAGILINLDPGKYKITYSFAGTDIYQGSSGSSILNVIKKSTYLRAYCTDTTFSDDSKAQVKLRDSDGNVLVNQTIRVSVNGKTYKYITDSKGNIFLKIVLKPGSYKAKIKFPGTASYYASNKTITLDVSKAVSNIVAADVIYYKSDKSKKFNVTLKNLKKEALANQKIYMVINKKTYMVRTNDKGVASKTISLPVGTYSVKYYYQGSKYYLGSRPAKNAKISILKDAIRFQADNLRMVYNKSNYTVKLLNAKGNPVYKANVTFTLAGNSYTVLTNKTGDASLHINKSVGIYKIKFSYVNPKNKNLSASGIKTIHITGAKTIITGKNISYKYGEFKQLVVTYKTTTGRVLPNNKVRFIVDGKMYTNITDANGVARFFINKTAGVYNVTYRVGNHSAFEETSNTSKVTVIGAIFTAKNLQWYTKIPSNYTVILTDHNGNPIANALVKFHIGNRTFKSYSNAKGITNLAINLKKGTYTVTFTYEGTSTLPGTSDTKKIVIIDKVIDTSSIKSLAKTLLIGVSGDYNRAKTLFNWVRDHISYRFYYNSLQGAEKTLKVRSGNCCDQSRLLVALFREAGLTARYVHGRCTFLDGTYDHVWTEVKINGKWYSADSVSKRNTFGHCAWKLVTIYNRYTDLPF
ncbi:transglutaminase domain-containing protein [uncultured Methanobrevibacter sp.]|uniref:transglutaminase domain-containing protein n=1 Tax=uncultured Methanobrevibacter sp. TaxID=253161 RepID=UPI0025DE9405|nr:transglutaminase domain-containing protein [uncultured Methanobrevibacter sp.]